MAVHSIISYRTSVKKSFASLFIPVIIFLLVFKPAIMAAGNPPVLVFNGSTLAFADDKLHFDMGEIPVGRNEAINIRIENRSDKNFRMANVRGSCGFTIPQWPRRTLAPGEEAIMQIRYDTSRPGVINRNLTINANTDHPVTIIKIKGNIVVPSADL